MNIFSQSKLTLKLKKMNSILSTDDINQPEINDSLKPEHLPNNSMVSENDSFVEILHTVQPNDEKVPMSQSIFKTFPDQNISNLLNESKQCPICFKMLDVNNFNNHVKFCGSSHNLSSKTIIKAVDLQERQAAEREALGLPKLTKSRDVKKTKKSNIKQKDLKIGSDSNLDLAIAMSVSLQESKEVEIINESEALLEAGLEKEALEKRKTLESFGFISNQPVKFKSKVTKTNSLLFKQTKEDREKIIAAKVAIIVFDVATDTLLPRMLENHCFKTKIESASLNLIRNTENRLWKKSLLEEENISEFYVENLSKFIKPSKTGKTFTDIVLSPARQNTSKHESKTSNKGYIGTLHTVIDNSNVDSICNASHEIVGNKRSDFSSKWESMIGNQYMSDVTIFSKDEHEIPAHTLVFYVQCPDILNDIEESNSFKSKKIIMWLEYSYEACLAFLKFIYSGQEPSISYENKADYLNLGTRYNVLMDIINDKKNGCVTNEQNKIEKRKNTEEFYNNSTDCKRYKASNPDMCMLDNNEKSFLNRHFLEITANNSQQALGILKSQLWLQSQDDKNLYTTNIITPRLTNYSRKKGHSFHSASTESFPLFETPDINHENSNVNVNSPDINVSSSKSLTKMSNFQNKPELITINSNSDSESIGIIQCNCIEKSNNNEMLISQPSTKYKNDVNTIELNDNSLNTNVLYPGCSSSMLNSRNNTFVNVNDKSSMFPAVTNVLSTNNVTKQISSNNNVRIIELVEESSSDSVSKINILNCSKTRNNSVISSPINNIEQSCQNSTSSFSNIIKSERNMSYGQTSSIIKSETNNFYNGSHLGNTSIIINKDFDFNLINSSDEVDSKSIECNNISSSLMTTCTEINDIKNNVNSINGNEIDVVAKLNSDSELLKNNSIMKTDVLLSSSSSEIINNYTSVIKLINTQVKPIQQSEIINTPPITDLMINNLPDDHDKDTSDVEQIIDDPWIDDYDLQPVYISPRCTPLQVSPDNSSIILINEPEEQTPPQKNLHNIDLDLQTALSISKKIGKNNFQNKNAVTPNKYGSKINTPKSLRRVQSESIIGSKEQVTPLPDYSSMKTPDLRKEYDRYGLKDLGRRKGKLILRHIYDTLHPVNNYKEVICKTELEQFSDSSNSSEHGIPDYYDGSYDELEIGSQTNTSNKISIEMGFKQLLAVDKDLHKKILCYEPIWIEDLKENLKQYNVNISMQKLMTFLDDKCVTFRSKSLTVQRQKTSKNNTKRKKLF